MNKKSNKKGEKFGIGLFIVFLAVSISLFAFITEENKITGFATLENNEEEVILQNNLMEFNDVNLLSTLAAGNYYIDSYGTVYWIDDNSKPAIAKVNFADESQKNRHIYIDDEGRIGYVLNPISIIQKH